MTNNVDAAPPAPVTMEEPAIIRLLQTLRWHRNAKDTVQAHGTPEALAAARETLVSAGWKEGISEGVFSMALSSPTEKESYARLTVHGEDKIVALQAAGVQIADKPSRAPTR